MEKGISMFRFNKIKGEASLLLAFIIIACTLVGVGTFLFTKKPETPLEEVAEAILFNQTGIDVDFSPDSPEE